jgi:hypothetical protein
MARKLLAAAALVLLCAASAQASRWSLETDEQGRHLLQAAKSPNCTRIEDRRTLLPVPQPEDPRHPPQ